MYAGGLFSVRQNDIQVNDVSENDVRLNNDSGKWRSAVQRLGKMSFGIMKFR